MVAGIKCAKCHWVISTDDFYAHGSIYLGKVVCPIVTELICQAVLKKLLPQRGLWGNIRNCLKDLKEESSQFMDQTIDGILDMLEAGMATYAHEMELECPQCKNKFWARIDYPEEFPAPAKLNSTQEPIE